MDTFLIYLAGALKEDRDMINAKFAKAGIYGNTINF